LTAWSAFGGPRPSSISRWSIALTGGARVRHLKSWTMV
jgi:hypothetical protein